MRILGFKVVEGQEIAFILIQFWIQDKYLPSDIAHTDKRVNDMGAEITRNIIYSVTTDIRSINGPVTEVTRYSGRLICWNFSK